MGNESYVEAINEYNTAGAGGLGALIVTGISFDTKTSQFTAQEPCKHELDVTEWSNGDVEGRCEKCGERMTVKRVIGGKARLMATRLLADTMDGGKALTKGELIVAYRELEDAAADELRAAKLLEQHVEILRSRLEAAGVLAAA